MERRSQGAFYTPAALVVPMVAQVLARAPARIVDAGCGSGRFSVALRRAGYDGPLIAVDRDPLACAMTVAHLAAAGLAPADVRCTDFLRLRLARTDGPTGWVGNPPYVRHHELTSDDKRWAKACAAHLGERVSGLAGLHVLFLLAMARAGHPGDVGCLVTSAEWLDARYGAVARHLLAGPLGLTSLDLFDAELPVFERVAATALVFGWEVGWGGPFRLGEHLRLGAPLGRGRALERGELAASERWSTLGRAVSSQGAGLVPLGSYARVHRGLATGANAFFTLSRHDAERRGLAPWARPCLCHAREVGEGRVAPAAGLRVLVCPPEEAAEQAAVQAWIRRGEDEQVKQAYLCQMRRCWWRLRPPASPPIVATYMARHPPRFALNPEGCAILNVLHGIWFREPVEAEVAAALVAWLNAHAKELRGARTYQGGLLKWEPRDLESVLVPPLAALRKAAGGNGE